MRIQESLVTLIKIKLPLPLLSVEKLRKKLSATSILLFSCGIGTVLTLPVILMINKELFSYSSDVWQAGICLGLTLALGQGLVAYSLKMFSSGFVSMVCLFDPILSATFAWLIFSETLNAYNLLGFVTVLFAMYLTAQSKSVIQE